MRTTGYLYIFLLLHSWLSGQNTMGVIHKEEDISEGYTLVSDIRSPNVFLIDNCGAIINKWETSCPRSGAAYLDSNGNLYRACVVNGSFSAGGITGAIKKYDWQGNELWTFTLANMDNQLHHDFVVLDDDRLLVLAFERFSADEWRTLGYDDQSFEFSIYSEAIFEIEMIDKTNHNILWEWHLADHMVQDVDTTLNNYGIIAENPRRLDINLIYVNSSDRYHFNTLDYNRELSQIMFGSKFLDEVFIIEKSDNSDIAASSEGGKYGIGGDFLYRMGNTVNYAPNSIVFNLNLSNPHNVKWALSDEDSMYVSIFNNRGSQGLTSQAIMVSLPITSDDRFDIENDIFREPEIIRVADRLGNNTFSSSTMSGIQLQDNGNWLIAVTQEQTLAEIDSDDNVVWEYKIPLRNGFPLTQGQNHTANGGTFNAQKYKPEYFTDISSPLESSGITIEMDGDISDCDPLLSIEHIEKESELCSILTSSNSVSILSNSESVLQVSILNPLGSIISNIELSTGAQWTVSDLETGLYFIHIGGSPSDINKTYKVYVP